jgi:hypothetical protein
MSAEDASTKMLVIGRNGRSSRLVADKHCATAWPHLAQKRDSAAGI